MRKGETIQDWWTDEEGNYFPWLYELWTWQKAQEADLISRTKRSSRSASSFETPKLSNLVACMAAIRAASEIWEPLTEMARLFPDPENLPRNKSRGLAGLIGDFCSWFRMKHGLDDLPFIYSGLYEILYDQERGALPSMSDAELLRQTKTSGSFIDDLISKEQVNG